MENLLKPFFNSSYAPHGYCLLWQPGLIWTHVIADSLIALSYFSIPLALISFVRRRNDIVFSSIFWLFALFIMACGATHIMSIWTLWYGSYGVEAVIKIITAIASVATAIVLWPLIPKALALPSPEKLSAANANLERMIGERDTALAEMREQISHRERVEAALVQSRKLEAMGQLTGGIAHDFNNLLQAISGGLELIDSHVTEPDRVRRWCNGAQRAVESGKTLTGRMLAFSRIQRLALIPVRIEPLIEGMAELIERSIGPMIHLEITSDDTDHIVIADRTQLELAILNLAINARDAMPEGGTLSIRIIERSGAAHPDLPEGDYVEIEVTDTGTGMTPDVLNRAVEPFFTTKGVGEGTGLGLSMVFGVVTQSGGTVAITSEPGKGTAVRLILRRATAALTPIETGSDIPSQENLRPLSGHTILLIDDDEKVRQVVADTLDDTGARILTAADGKAGLKLLEKENPDLLIVDFAMPGMNGVEVAKLARQARAGLPVLIITGYSESAQIEEITGPGTDVLRKPFLRAQLLAAAGALLAGRASAA